MCKTNPQPTEIFVQFLYTSIWLYVKAKFDVVKKLWYSGEHSIFHVNDLDDEKQQPQYWSSSSMQ